MIQIDNVEVFNLEGALRGMRNPMNSWSKSDSGFGCCVPTNHISFVKCSECNPALFELCDKKRSYYLVGRSDLELMKRLFRGGTEHRKYLRQIFVSMDITAPLYWWKEFDTYKVGTVANSCSTMHMITKKEFELSDFSLDHIITNDWSECDNFRGSCPGDVMDSVIAILNECRNLYNESVECKDMNRAKLFWWQIIQLLPTSYNQKRTVTMNYENVFNIIKQRSGHKLDEWHKFVDELKKLPYVESLLNA